MRFLLNDKVKKKKKMEKRKKETIFFVLVSQATVGFILYVRSILNHYKEFAQFKENQNQFTVLFIFESLL